MIKTYFNRQLKKKHITSINNNLEQKENLINQIVYSLEKNSIKNETSYTKFIASFLFVSIEPR